MDARHRETEHCHRVTKNFEYREIFWTKSIIHEKKVFTKLFGLSINNEI